MENNLGIKEETASVRDNEGPIIKLLILLINDIS